MVNIGRSENLIDFEEVDIAADGMVEEKNSDPSLLSGVVGDSGGGRIIIEAITGKKEAIGKMGATGRARVKKKQRVGLVLCSILFGLYLITRLLYCTYVPIEHFQASIYYYPSLTCCGYL